MTDTLTFGSRAFSFADSTNDLLIVGIDGVEDALLEAVRRRRRGLSFGVFPVLEDPRAALTAVLALHITSSTPDCDEAQRAFGALAAGTLSVDGRPQNTMSALEPGALEALGIVCRLADRIIVRSHAEYERMCMAFNHRFDRPVVMLPASRVPAFTAAPRGDAIVIWAAERRAETLAHLVFALREIRFPVIAVSSESTLEAGAAALVRARLVILADSCGPEDALAMAERGIALAVASTSGADEYLDDVLVYEPWERGSILAAAMTGFGAAGARRHGIAVTLPCLEPRRALLPDAAGPLVSLIIRTYNRPALLRTALESAVAQEYRNLEIIVVNDAGEDVRAMLGGIPRTRYAEHDRRRGPNAAANTGVRLAQGTYVGLLDDDDVLFPNHVGVLVGALQSGTAHVAHSDALSWYLSARADGTYDVTGFKLFLDRAVVPSELYHTCAVLPLTLLARRSAIAAVGGYPEDIPLMGDWDTFMRLAQRYDFVHVPRVTALYSIRDDQSNLTADPAARFTQSFNMIRERNSVVHRPLIHKMQLEMMGNREIQGGPIWPQPAITIAAVAASDLR